MFCHFSFDAKFPNSDHCLEYVLFPFCCVYVYVVFSQLKCRREKLGRRETVGPEGNDLGSDHCCQVLSASIGSDTFPVYSFPGLANTCLSGICGYVSIK